MNNNNSYASYAKKASYRVSYVPRPGYNRSYQTNSPKIDNLYLPKKCGFSLPFDHTITMEKYLCAVGDIVGDDKMVFAGKNSDLVKMYLVSEQEVNKFYEHHPQLVIDNKVLSVRKLVDNGHKIFLCNVDPATPDHILTNELSKYTKVVSGVSFVNLGLRGNRFTHLIGFRRQVVVDSVENLPAFFEVFEDNTVHKIYINIDKAKCYKCHLEGHLLKNCPSSNSTSNVQDRLAIDVNKTADPQDSTTSIQAAPSQPTIPSQNVFSGTFLPSFANRTTVGAPRDSNDVSHSSSSSSSSPLAASECISTPEVVVSDSKDKLATQASVQISTPIVKEVTKTPVIKEASNTSVLADSDDDMLDVTHNNDKSVVGKSKKRVSSCSPDNDNCDKKICIETSDDDLQFLIPGLEVVAPSIDPKVFINLIDDMRHQVLKRKIDIIKSQYQMEPSDVSALLSRLANNELVSSRKKIKNRLNNLSKTLAGAALDGLAENDSTPQSQS